MKKTTTNPPPYNRLNNGQDSCHQVLNDIKPEEYGLKYQGGERADCGILLNGKMISGRQ